MGTVREDGAGCQSVPWPLCAPSQRPPLGSALPSVSETTATPGVGAGGCPVSECHRLEAPALRGAAAWPRRCVCRRGHKGALFVRDGSEVQGGPERMGLG